ncbi:alpha-L-rhamnosidase [Paenibacillus nasutitermitis]|uniref:alpha-L-rhamnosidase n=1 Tax=Paenibacillus nasutitermitis TaxID=1652958 RepID=A0A916ZGF9_9BACL|nr:alpha-L-rhamnosidase [Paenibacillus nasutitermitis]GGD94281.1 alpha-rhamnosidase [Paenibacillus nasutitermitis]
MLTIHHLRVNDHKEPLGIGNEPIRFSWRLGSETRGAGTETTRLHVASSRELLLSGKGDIWEAESQERNLLQVDYNGPAFEGRRRYWWRVSVTDREGHRTESEIAFFDTGLFMDQWKAKWIWRPGKRQVNDFVYFRKEMNLRKPVALAKIFVSAHNVFQLYVNGTRLGGSVSPAPTHPGKHKYVMAYDATALLEKGRNALGVIAHYLGGTGQNYVDGLPGFCLQMEIDYTDGSSQTFKTDASWLVLADPPHRSGTDYQQNRRVSAIEDVDARKLPGDWNRAGGGSGEWLKAKLAAASVQRWSPMWQPIPEGAVEELIVPAVTQPAHIRDEERVQVFDAGRIISGWPLIKLQGIAGVTLRIRYSEDLDENGRVKHHVANETSASYYDQYTMRGDDTESWQPDLSYKAFRYLEVTGYPDDIIPGENLWAVSAHTDLAYEGQFACSSSLLNDMYEASIRTQKNNVLGQVVDCPHREQAQYLADSDLQAEALLFNFDARHILEKVNADFADSQYADGTFPFVFPSNNAHPDFNLQIPEWDLHYNTLLWKIYYIYGDERILEKYYGTAKRMADYYLGILDKELGLVPLDKGWHISDWPYPTVDHDSRVLTVENMKLYAAVQVLVDMASLTGREEDRAAYSSQLDRLKTNIVKHLYDRSHRRFRDALDSDRMHQGVSGLGLHLDLVPEEDKPALVEALADGPWECRTVLGLPLLRALFENGRPDAAYGIIDNGEYPGWGYMIRQGAKTMWEGWEDIESHSHAWNGYPARLMQEYMAGIQPAGPGFEQVRIKPYPAPELAFAEASVPTVRGAVQVRWERLENGLRLISDIPTTMTAEIMLRMPETGGITSIRESQGEVWKDGSFVSGVAGVLGGDKRGDLLVLRLESGRYEFTII